MSRNACNGENGEKSPEGWRIKLDAKSGPLESGDFGKNGKFGWRKLAENRQRAGESNQMAKVAP